MTQSQVDCPVCQHTIALKDLRAGRFRVKCPRCGSPLVLTVEICTETSIKAEVELAETGESSQATPTPSITFIPTTIGTRWLGRYRLRGDWDAVRAGVGHWGRWLGVGPRVGLVSTRDAWATDSRFMARWTLEGFGSTQLRHPNLAHSFEVGVAEDRVFSAASVADSTPLSALSGGRAPLNRQARASAILHAARGLRFAHEQGIFHRDLGLEAIRIDDGGRVTVTGLGVGLTPGAADSSMKSAAQGDVEQLGRALATLVGGAGDRAVPPGLAGLIRRMVVDDGERFPDMGAVVRALEAELGVAGPLTPSEAETEEFASALLDYQTAPLAGVRRWVSPLVLGALGLVVLILLGTGRVMPAAGWLMFGALASASLLAFRGVAARHRIKSRIAAPLAVVGRRDLMTLAGVGALGLAALMVTHLLGTWIFLTILAIGLAAAYHFGLDRPLAQSRAEVFERLEATVRGWRQAGVDEAAIRRYVAGAGGKGWEEVFAALFGSDTVTPARAIWGPDLLGRPRPRFAPVQGWISERLDAFVLGRIDDQTRGLLVPILERDLEARGMHVLTARRKSKRAAEAVVAVATQYRQSLDGSVGLPLVEAFRKAVEHPEEFLLSPEIAEAAEPPRWRSAVAFGFAVVFGSRSRFVLGAACLAGAFVWMEQNALISYQEAQGAVLAATVEGDRAGAVGQARAIGAKFVQGVAQVIDAPNQGEAIQLGLIPEAVAHHLNGFALAVSGLILLVSSLIPGHRLIPFALVAALIPLTPRLVVPSARPLDPVALGAMAVGVGVFAVGLILQRGRAD